MRKPKQRKFGSSQLAAFIIVLLVTCNMCMFIASSHIYFSSTTKEATKQNNEIIKAVNTMRCFTTPGCYPSVKCMDEAKPMRIGIPQKWEHHSFCNSDMEKVKDNCLIYSFGLDKSTEWEQRMAKKYGCDVYGFDPTSNFAEDVAPGVKFYKYGLRGVDESNIAATHSILYDEIDPSRLRTLSQIVKILGHERRKIDILRLDCEGCEYGVLKQLACGGDSHLVNQLMIEFHFQKNLGIATDEDILIGADALNCLEDNRWGITSMEKRGCSEADAQYTQSALKIIKTPQFLLFITMRRIKETEMLTHELYEDVVKASNEELRAVRLSPDDVEYKKQLRVERVEATKRYNSIFVDRNGEFDVDTEVVSEE